jgi:hypothetical protein
MKLFKRPFLAIGLVLAVHIVLVATGAYEINHIDTPMHVAGGFVMAMLGIAIHRAVASAHHTAFAPMWYHFLFVVGFAMLVGVAWEFYEYVFDQTVAVWFEIARAQLSLADTMKDLLMDGLGATVAFALKRRQL